MILLSMCSRSSVDRASPGVREVMGLIPVGDSLSHARAMLISSLFTSQILVMKIERVLGSGSHTHTQFF